MCAMLCRCGFIKATENTKIYHTEFNISLGYNWMYERTVQEIIRFEADKYCIVGPGLPTICILQLQYTANFTVAQIDTSVAAALLKYANP